MAAAARRPRVLVVGGWSPGPLGILRQCFRHVDFEEPAIPMPPAGCRWCLNPFWLVLVLYLCAAFPAMMNRTDRASDSAMVCWLLRGALCVLTVVLVRLLVAGLVWYSVRDAMSIISRRIQAWQPDLVIGFSWGGGVVCWMLEARLWEGPSILLAPTVNAMAHAACSSKPRLPVLGPGRSVHVFHAKGDGFCPEVQVQDFREDGCEVQVCRDDHTLCKPSTVEKIAEVMSAALSQQAREGPNLPTRVIAGTSEAVE